MACEWRGHMASDPRANLLVVTRGNGSLKSEGFLKHDHFVCQPAHSHINQKTTFWNTNISNIKRERNSKQSNLHFTLLYTHKIRKIYIHNDEGIYFPHIETCMPLCKNNIESSIQWQVQQMNIVKKKQGHMHTIFKNPCKFVNFYWKHFTTWT